jgi:hypothetical protein
MEDGAACCVRFACFGTVIFPLCRVYFYILTRNRLNSGDVNSKSAQAASCLKPKDFKRVYGLVKTAIEEAESSAVVTYQQLYKKYSSQGNSTFVDPYIMEAENELQPHAIGYEMESTMFRSVCYFWVLSILAVSINLISCLLASEHPIAQSSAINREVCL